MFFKFLLLLYLNYMVMCKSGRECTVSLSNFPVFRKRYTFVLRSLHVRVALVTRTCCARFTYVFHALHERVTESSIERSFLYDGMLGLLRFEVIVILRESKVLVSHKIACLMVFRQIICIGIYFKKIFNYLKKVYYLACNL